MTATGGPWSRRPFADETIAADRLRAFDEAAYKAARRRFLERFSTARQTRIRHEILVGVEGFLARGGLYARGTAIRQDLPALLIILEIRDHNLAEDLLMNRRIENRAQNFNAPVEITGHHVGRRNINRRFRMRQRVASTKAINPTVFEEATNNRFDADVFGQSRHSRTQATNAAYHQINGDAGSRGFVERVDNSRIDERIHFHPDRRRPPGFGVSNLLRNMVENSLAQIDWRDRHALELRRFSVSGDIVEDARHISSDHLVGSKKREVRVNARRDRMIVAGANMNVSRKFPRFTTHHQ